MVIHSSCVPEKGKQANKKQGRGDLVHCFSSFQLIAGSGSFFSRGLLIAKVEFELLSLAKPLYYMGPLITNYSAKK